jgi:hypothetical protein
MTRNVMSPCVARQLSELRAYLEGTADICVYGITGYGDCVVLICPLDGAAFAPAFISSSARHACDAEGEAN